MSTQRKPVVLLTWIGDSKDPAGFEKIELPIKTADMLINQGKKTSKPKYIPLEDLVRYGYEEKTPAKAKESEIDAKAKIVKNKKETPQTDPVVPKSLKTKEEVEKEKEAE